MSDINISTQEYIKVIPQISYYLRSHRLPPIFKYKCPLFAAAGHSRRIYIFSNSLEHMGTFSGHKKCIQCLCAISNKILASGSRDNKIKIWNIENKVIISTLSQKTSIVSALCNINEGVFVSGSGDKSLIIWSLCKIPESPSTSTSTYFHRVLTGHKSYITGIIRINKREIICSEVEGDLRIWDIIEGVCTIYIPSVGGAINYIYQMKQHKESVVAISYNRKISIWGAANNWGHPIIQFGVCYGSSIEFLGDILIRGGKKGELKFIDYGVTGCSLPSPIRGLHSSEILGIQRIAKNIIVTISTDRSLKVIDSMSGNGYLNFMRGDLWMIAIAYFY